MFTKVLLSLLLISNVYYNILASFKYSVELHDEKIFVPCNRSDVYFLDRFVDISDMKFELLENGSIYVYGSALWTRDLGTDKPAKNSLLIQVYKKDRDRWSPTIYNIKREDVCTALFNPADIFYQYVRNVPKEYKKCPLFLGQKFPFDVIADFHIFLSDPALAGEYMANIVAHFKGVNEYFCTNVFGEFYRS